MHPIPAMRIGIVVNDSIERISGGHLYDRKLADYLRRQGDMVEVIPIPSARRLPKALDNFSRDLHRRLLSAPRDLLIEDEAAYPSLFRLNGFLKRNERFPIISLVHRLRGSDPDAGWIGRSAEAAYLRSVDGFIFNSASTAASVGKLLGREPVSLIAPPGKDSIAPYEERKAQEASPLVIIFVGNVLRRKGLHVLIEALSRLDDVDWQLRIVGSLWVEKNYADSIRAGVCRDGISSRVRIYGRVPERKLCELLHTSHLLAIPSLSEGMGVSYLEAMGFGLPVIASSSGGAGEIITDGREGFLVAPENATLLASRIGQLARDPQLRLEMGHNAYERFRLAPTWDETCSRIRAFLSGFPRKDSYR